MGALYNISKKPTDLVADSMTMKPLLKNIARNDPILGHTTQRLLDAEGNARRNIMGTNTPEIEQPASLNVEPPGASPSMTAARRILAGRTGAPRAGAASQSLLG